MTDAEYAALRPGDDVLVHATVCPLGPTVDVGTHVRVRVADGGGVFYAALRLVEIPARATARIGGVVLHACDAQGRVIQAV